MAVTRPKDRLNRTVDAIHRVRRPPAPRTSSVRACHGRTATAGPRPQDAPDIRSVCRQFVVFCQRLDLSGEALVAIGGSKFKAANRRDRTFTSGKSERRMRDIAASINRYQKYGRYSRYGYADTPRCRQHASVRDVGEGAHGRVQCSG